MQFRNLAALLMALVATSACSPTVGTNCDENLARTAYYRTSDGMPAYGGQALILENCSSCHSDPGAFGAPAGLEMDANLVTGTGEDAITQGRHLLSRQTIIHRHRDLIYGQVVGGHMPPRGFVPAESGYEDADGNALPSITTPAAHEILRNWLACRSPVIERTTPLDVSCTNNADCVVTYRCDTELMTCEGVGRVVAARPTEDCSTPRPEWPWIWACKFSPDATQGGCTGGSCHGGNFGGGLVMSSRDAAYEALVNEVPLCAGHEAFVIPNDPDSSLLIHKLEGVGEGGMPLCGSRMPVPGIGEPFTEAEIANIRMWIANGASREGT